MTVLEVSPAVSAETVAELLDGVVEGGRVLASQHVVSVAGARLTVTERHVGQAADARRHLAPLVVLVAGLHARGHAVQAGRDLPRCDEPGAGAGLPAWAARVPLADVAPQPARTWGEIAVNHGWWSAAERRLERLQLLPHEVLVLTPAALHRYTVDDPATLADLDTITFGLGRSRLLSDGSWRELAARAGEAGRHDLAARCSEQGSDADEAAYWRARADWVAVDHTPGPPVEVRVEPWAALVAALPSYGEELVALRDRLVRERAEVEDHHVALSGGTTVTGRELLDAGVSPQALALLGHRADPVPPHARYDLVAVRLGDEVLWGSHTHLLRRRDPAVVHLVR